MESAKLQAINHAVTGFRRALETYVGEDPHQFLARLPAGACKAVSLLLARYLHDMGFGSPYLVANGDRAPEGETWETHAWLQLDGLLIDITADQFGQPPVMITDRSSFHECFRGQQEYAFDSYMRMNAWYEEQHLQIYADLLDRIPLRDNG